MIPACEDADIIARRIAELEAERKAILATDTRVVRLQELRDAAGIQEGMVIPDEIRLAAGFSQEEIDEIKRALEPPALIVGILNGSVIARVYRT